jgi:uncharacterized heparinase superfamily protein
MSSCQFVAATAMKRFLQGAPIIGGPTNVECYREATGDGIMLIASHDGYARQFGLIHRRSILMSDDGTRIDGEDALEAVPGMTIRGGDDDFALRFHLHPAIKASRLSDGRAVMLVLANRDVWTFEALDDRVDVEDSVFLAGSDGPRRTAQIVIRQRARQAPRVRWSVVRSPASPSATNARRQSRREPELPL